MADVPAWIPITSALLGGGLVGILDLIKHRQNIKSEERKHIHELAMNTAFKYWQQHSEQALENHRRTGQKNVVPPIDSYLIHLLKLSEVMVNGKIDKTNIESKLREIYEIEDIADKVIKSSQ